MTFQIFRRGRALAPGARLALQLAAGLLLLILLLAGASKLGFKFDPFNLGESRLNKARTSAVQAQGEAAVNAAATAAGVAALEAYDARAARTRKTLQTRGENRHAILSSPGAGEPVDPALARTFADGLCKYAAYRDDPGCGGLHGVPGSAEEADAAGPAPPR